MQALTEQEKVRKKLKTAILAGKYAPRQRLIEADIAIEFHASRFNVRNALNQLASEGLIEQERNKGSRVREISVSEATEITELRLVIESLIAGKAAERISNHEIKEMQALKSEMKRAVKLGEYRKYSELNTNLHLEIRRIANDKTASDVLEKLNSQLVRHQFQIYAIPGRSDISLTEHIEIIDALCSRDKKSAESSMKRHIGSVLKVIQAQTNSLNFYTD